MINFIVLFYIFFKFVTNNQLTSAESVDNFYGENDKILAVIDDIFISLKINENFKKPKNVSDYMSIHNYIQDAVENRNKKYKEIYNLSTITPCHKAAYYVSIINKAIGELINEHNVTNNELFFNNNKLATPEASDDILTDFVSLAEQLSLNLNKNTIAVKDYEIAKNVETRRIFYGAQAEITDWPFVVSVHIAGSFACAGSIIREDLVLSAASCFGKFYKKKLKKEFKNNIWIRAGSDFFNSGGVMIRAVMLHFHPKFNPVERSNNIVVIQLKLKLRFKRRLILPIKFARKRTTYRGVVIIGWGNTEYESRSAPDSPEFVRMTQQPSMGRRYRNIHEVDLNIENRHLQHAVLDSYSRLDCVSVYPRHTITNRNFCAGSSIQGSGACKYDLGGPGIIGMELQGVVSFGPSRCGIRDAPTVFTKIYRYARWLDKLFCKIPLTNDTVEDSEQMGALVKLGPVGEKVLYTDESYILNEIRKDIQSGYRNQSDLDLPIEEDNINLREVSQDTPLPNNIYLDPNLVNSSDVFEKLKEHESTPVTSEPGEETGEVYNWVLYKEFMAQLLNNNSNDQTTEASGATEESLAQSSTADTVSLLSEMQEEYDAEYKQTKVEFEYYEVMSNVTNDDKDRVQIQNGQSNTPNNAKQEAQTQNDTPNDLNNDKDKPQTQKNELEYENILVNEDPVNTKRGANDLAEIIISDSGTTQILLLNKKDPGAVNSFINELSRLKERIALTSTMRAFYREEGETEK